MQLAMDDNPRRNSGTSMRQNTVGGSQLTDLKSKLKSTPSKTPTLQSVSSTARAPIMMPSSLPAKEEFTSFTRRQQDELATRGLSFIGSEGSSAVFYGNSQLQALSE